MQLNDSYILKWNNGRLPDGLMVMASYTNGTDITLNFNLDTLSNRTPEYLRGVSQQPIGDPEIDFKFVFSVSKKRFSEFFEIFDKLSKRKLDNKVRLKNGTYDYIDANIKPEIEQLDHFVGDCEYTRYTYEFQGSASSIMAYIYILETSIDLFSQIWGYDENGEEHFLLKYPVGTMVCLNGDQSVDYLIIDLQYFTNGSNTISYIISEMLYVGSVIKYGETKIVRESDITWSRNGRINDILG